MYLLQASFSKDDQAIAVTVCACSKSHIIIKIGQCVYAVVMTLWPAYACGEADLQL